MVASSQWLIMSISCFFASRKASRAISAFCTGEPSSERATAPAALSAAKSVIFSPFCPKVTAAMGKTFTAAFFARSRIYSTPAGVSVTGFVFGMQAAEVTPPAAAAREALSMSSLYSKPGSRICTCISTSPAQTLSPPASKTSSARHSPPTDTILPLSTAISTRLPPSTAFLITSIPAPPFVFFIIFAKAVFGKQINSSAGHT